MARRKSLSKSILAGAAGGLAGAFLMSQTRSLINVVTKKFNGAKRQSQSEGDDATVKTASSISRGVFHHELTPSEKKWAGPVVHYAFGGLVGALYGGIAHAAPSVKSGYGTAYGAAVWAGADEAAVPALHLSKPLRQTKPREHASGLAMHLVYGLTTDLTRRLILRRNA